MWTLPGTHHLISLMTVKCSSRWTLYSARKWVCHRPIGSVVRGWPHHGHPSSARGNTLRHLNFSFLAAQNANFFSVVYIRFSNIWKSRDLEGNARATEALNLSFSSDWLLSITYTMSDRGWVWGTGYQDRKGPLGYRMAEGSFWIADCTLSHKGLEGPH